MKVHQLENKNQFIIFNNKYRVFQSYNSTVAIYNIENNTLYLNRSKWDYSKTTLKHLYIFIINYTSQVYDAMLYYYQNNKRKSIQHYIDKFKCYNDIKYNINNVVIELTETEIIDYRNNL